MWFADARARRERDEYQLGLRDVLLIGCFQVLALIPGTSRSGITITMALMLGLSRSNAARFSFLLAIPTILGATVLTSLDLVAAPEPVNYAQLLTGLACSIGLAQTSLRLAVIIQGLVFKRRHKDYPSFRPPSRNPLKSRA